MTLSKHENENIDLFFKRYAEQNEILDVIIWTYAKLRGELSETRSDRFEKANPNFVKIDDQVRKSLDKIEQCFADIDRASAEIERLARQTRNAQLPLWLQNLIKSAPLQ